MVVGVCEGKSEAETDVRGWAGEENQGVHEPELPSTEEGRYTGETEHVSVLDFHLLKKVDTLEKQNM